MNGAHDDETSASEHDPADSPAAYVEDPPVILGTWRGRWRS